MNLSDAKTPWQRVFEKFGMSQRALGAAIGRDGAKINRAIKDPDGLINGRDQKRLLELAAERGVNLTADDVAPVDHG